MMQIKLDDGTYYLTEKIVFGSDEIYFRSFNIDGEEIHVNQKVIDIKDITLI